LQQTLQQRPTHPPLQIKRMAILAAAGFYTIFANFANHLAEDFTIEHQSCHLKLLPLLPNLPTDNTDTDDTDDICDKSTDSQQH